jgi:hypothetical protein
VVAGALYRLVTVDGEELGERTFATLSWNPGDVIPLGGDGALEVVELREGNPPRLVVRQP